MLCFYGAGTGTVLALKIKLVLALQHKNIVVKDDKFEDFFFMTVFLQSAFFQCACLLFSANLFRRGSGWGRGKRR